MKTIEFQLYLNQEQRSRIDDWLETLKRVWNRALAILEWKQYYNRLQKCLEAELSEDWGFDIKPTAISCYKLHKNYVLYTPIAADFRLDKSKGWEVEGNVESRQVVNLIKSHWATEPLIQRYSAIDLRKPFAQIRYPWIKDQDIPMVLVNDYLKLIVFEAWKRYQQGKANKPKYKGRRDKIKTLASESFRAQGKIDWEASKVFLPKLGWLKVRHISDRITPGADISTFKIVRKPSGYYLQLGWVDAPPRKKRAKQRNTTIELSQSSYREHIAIAIPSYLEKSLKKLTIEQQKLSRCEYGSNKWEKQKRIVGQIQEKIKAQREGWQHWHSARISDIYSDIAIVEDKKQPIPKPDPKINESRTAYNFNGAERIAEINRQRSDSALAEFKTKIKQKLVDGGSIVELEKENASDKKKAKATKRKRSKKSTLKKQNLDNQIATGSKNVRKTSRSHRSRNKKKRSVQDSLETLAE